LTHDFAKKNNAPSRAPRVAGWVWAFTSLVTAGFVAFIYYLADITPEADSFAREVNHHVNTAKPIEDTTHSNKPSIVKKQYSKPEANGPRFTFYDELARLKMVPKEVEKFLPRLSKAEKRIEREKEKEIKKLAQKIKTAPHHTTLTAERQTSLSRYMLQTDSFQNAVDADRRRAELLLMGMDAQVQTVTLASGNTWHRVTVGPFTGEKALHRAQNQLAQMNIAAAIRKID